MPLFGRVGKKRKRAKPWYAHGKYWGPNWSGGKRQKSIDYREDPNAPLPVDKDDYIAREHDAEYARVDKRARASRKRPRFDDVDLRNADNKFAKLEWKTGTIRGKVGGTLVGLQGAMRGAVGAVNDFLYRRRIPETPERDLNNNNEQNMSIRISKFKFPSKRPQRSRFDGSRGSLDYVWNQAGKEAAHFGVSSFERWVSRSSPLYHLACVLLKDIFKRYARVDVESHSQNLRALLGIGTHQNVTDVTTRLRMVPIAEIVWMYKTMANEGSSPAITGVAFVSSTVSGQEVRNITFSEFAMEVARGLHYNFARSPLLSYSSNAYSIRRLFGVSVQGITWDDGAANTNIYRQVHPPVRYDNRMVNIKCYTTIRVQNQTHPMYISTIGEGKRENIGQNPVKNKIMYFGDPFPILRGFQGVRPYVVTTGAGSTGAFDSIGGQGGYAYVQDYNGDGIIKPSSTTVTGWEKLPTDDMFTNMRKSSYNMMQVDEIKTIPLSFKFYGLINDFFAGFTGADPGGFVDPAAALNTNVAIAVVNDPHIKLHGTHLMFSFEKYMPDTPAAATESDVTVEVLVRRTSSVSLGRSRKERMLPFRAFETKEALTLDNQTIAAGTKVLAEKAAVTDDVTAGEQMEVEAGK